jgi:pentapeptide MXKDX repeat protein
LLSTAAKAASQGRDGGNQTLLPPEYIPLADTRYRSGLTLGACRSAHDGGHCTMTPFDALARIMLVAAAAALTTFGAAQAQDKMKKDGMKPDMMKSDGMKGEMKGDAMKHDAMKGDAMKGDAKMKDGMKPDMMKK